MILPNVGLNEWGHAFWISEELFVAPLHWGFVVLGWTGLCLGGVLMQVVFRCSRLLSAVSEESRAQAVA
jgi:methane/ammonia monooxygenase subunit C